MKRSDKVKELDPTLERIAKEAADEVGIFTTQMKEAYHIYMQLNLQHIRKQIPVLIPNMGYFFLSPYKTERLIDRMFQSMRNRMKGDDPEGMTREDVAEKLKKYWPIHNVARTHYTRRGNRYHAKRRWEEQQSLLRQHGNGEQL